MLSLFNPTFQQLNNANWFHPTLIPLKAIFYKFGVAVRLKSSFSDNKNGYVEKKKIPNKSHIPFAVEMNDNRKFNINLPTFSVIP